MSLQNALLFIRRVRTDETLRQAIYKLSVQVEPDALERMGVELELPFTVEELQLAYQQDWVIRWRHYSMSRIQAEGDVAS